MTQRQRIANMMQTMRKDGRTWLQIADAVIAMIEKAPPVRLGVNDETH